MAVDDEHRPTNEQGPPNEGDGPPVVGRPLTRAEVEAILGELGAWKDGKQVRPLWQHDVNELLAMNARVWLKPDPTGEQLPLSGLKFAKQVNFSSRVFALADFRSTELPFPDFKSANLFNARFLDAVLVGADFTGANLVMAEFQRSRLDQANFKDADLKYAYFSGAYLPHARFESASLENVVWHTGKRRDWMEYLRPEEEKAERCEDEAQKASWLLFAEQVYRTLKRANQIAAIHDVADQFAYREQFVRKKQALIEKRWVNGASLQFAELLFGYGYRWKRVVASAAVVLFSFWLLYWLAGLGTPQSGPPPVLNALYFSAVSFTAVGYGAWVSTTGADLGWPKYLGAAEAIVGVFLMALFLVTFTRQYLR